MMRRVLFLLTAAALVAGVGSAADLTDTERNDRYQTYFDFASLVRGGSVQPHWLTDGRFWYTTGEGTELQALLVDPVSGAQKPLIDAQRVREALAATASDLPVGAGLPFAVFTVDDSLQAVSFEVGEKRYSLNLDTYVLSESKTAVAPASAGESLPPENLPGPAGVVAVIRENNLWLQTVDGSNPVQVTDDGSDDQPWSLYGAIWSDDGSWLAFPRWDVGVAPSIPIVDWFDPGAPVSREPANQAGQPRIGSTLHLVHHSGGAVIQAQLQPTLAEPYWYPLGWVPGTGELLAMRINRIMTRQDLIAVDPGTGRARPIITEHSDTFIDGLAASFMIEHYYTPVGDGEHFIWLSERDGYHNLYLYRYDGAQIRQLTQADFPVVWVEGVDAEEGWVYFKARPDVHDPTSRQLCRVGLDGKGFKQLTENPGRRRIHLAPDFSCFVDNHSDLDRAPAAVLRRADGTFVCELARADISRLDDLGWQAPFRAVAKAADGKSDCFCAIYLPPGFDPELKYPVIEVIYAGPQWMIVPRRFVAGEYGDTALSLSQLGYVVVIIDSPGTADIGKAYQDAVYGRLGQIEIPDHVAALRDLARTRPWLDLDRVGVHGKSWGGYFTLRAMLMAPEFYKVGVCSAPVVDLATSADAPVVPYLRQPADNPEAYTAADCLPLAGRLAGDLLLTIGTSDRNTPFGHTMRMISAFIEAGKDVELVVLPGQHHWLQGASFERWQRAMRDFFREHLPPRVEG